MSGFASQLVIEALVGGAATPVVSQLVIEALSGTDAALAGAINPYSAQSSVQTRGRALSGAQGPSTQAAVRLSAQHAIAAPIAPTSVFSVTLGRISVDAGLRVGQMIAAVLGAGGGEARVGQIVAAVLAHSGGVSQPQVSQLLAEVLAAAASTTRASQQIISLLMWIYEVPMPAIYPTLPGLSYSVIKRPKWFTGTGTSVSGREARVAYASAPLWEWDLTYSYLPDRPAEAAATASDLKQLLGFYLSQSGGFGGFLFADPDDNSVTGQAIATTDGVSRIWTLIRTYGGSDGTGTEPIGYINATAPLNVYLDGVVQDPSSYDLITTVPVNQQLRLHFIPAAGALLSVDMQYYYYVRFQEDQYEFEKFMDQLWSVQKITLMSLRN